MSNVYEVLVGKNSLGFFEADSKPAARVAAVKPVTVRLVDSGEVMRLMKAGTKINQVEGEAQQEPEPEPEAPDENQQPLTFGDADSDDDHQLGG